MVKKGRNTYVPAFVLDSIANLQKEQGIPQNEAFNKMAGYAKIGIEAERILDITKNPFKKRKRDSIF